MKCWQIPLITIPYKIICILFFLPDPSITIVNNLGITPYGILWYLINWVSWIDLNLWVWYLLPFDIALSCLMWQLNSYHRAMIYTIYNLWLWWDEFSNLSVMWFSQFGFLNPVFIILSVLTKIPLPFQTGPWEYAFGSNWRLFSAPRMISYSLIGLSWLWPITYWLRKWIKRSK